MCGLFGWKVAPGQALDLDVVARATSRMSARGPDDSGFALVDTPSGRVVHCGGPDSARELDLPPIEAFRSQRFDLALGFRRLSILDPSPSGHQPMASPDGRRLLVFNGEIYNYLELRDQLESGDWQFRSHTDTEVLLAALRTWGPAAVKRMVGMFAFALLDLSGSTLTLGRDFFGIKPLYTARFEGGFAFASEIAALLELPGLPRRVNPHRLFDYLRFGLTDHGRGSLIEGIEQLPPAHLLSVSLKDAPGLHEPQPYWRLAPLGRADLSLEEAASELRERFLDSVRLHLRSDVKLGAALSGGVDSSAIVMAMRHVEGRPLEQHTFSYVAEEPRLDEERWVDVVARAAGARVHKTRLGAGDLREDLMGLVEAQQEPFGSTSIFAQYRVFRSARDAGVKVMLGGQGADELFGGYRSHLGPRLASLLRGGKWGQALRFLRSASQLPEARARDMLMRAGARLLPRRAQGLARRLADEPLYPAWLDASWFQERAVVAADPWQTHQRDVLREHLTQAVTHASLPMLLRYEDRNSMTHSIESRVPFLTPALAELALSLPEAYLIGPDGTSKRVLRLALAGLVPHEVLERRDKIGFATPERGWLGELGSVALSAWGDDLSQRIPALDWQRVRREWSEIAARQRSFDFRAWRWLNLALWTRRFGIVYD